jgi:cytidylate kinase
MGFRVVCLSRSIAAGGETVGQTVAERLGFRYLDEQIITRAAELAQVDPKLVAAAETRQPLLQRLIDKLAAAYDVTGPASIASGMAPDAFMPPSAYRASPDDLRPLIRAAIAEVASTGEVVIVAHAASMALAGKPGVLRVLVTASPETRARRLAAEQGTTEKEALAAVAESDRARCDYFRRFYQIKEELPTHYDLVVNTDVVPAERVADIVVAAAQSGV